MLRDVFYYGKKPNVHPREKFATSLEDARSQCTTEHFWIINEYCDYRGFDWDFDFEFLPDEDVWAEEHNNVWPSQHQKDSGTWLCNAANNQPLIVYRADVNAIKRKNITSDNWVILSPIDNLKFDFSWHPDPTDPPYIYVWGNQWHSGKVMPTIEYHVLGATAIKYVENNIAILAQQPKNFVVFEEVVDFDFSWVPNPTSPPYIYVWGNQWNTPEDAISIQYVVEGAKEYKYMQQRAIRKPCKDNWHIPTDVDVNAFDFSWVPSPHDEPFIYQFGTQWQKTGGPQYIAPGIVKLSNGNYLGPVKYIDIQTAKKLPSKTDFNILDDNVIDDFDYSWHPDDTEPPYIYVFGNNQYPAQIMPTVEYVVKGATQVKHMHNIVATLGVNKTNWVIHQPIDETKFNLSWVPNPKSPPYIYVWGNKYIEATLKPTVEYVVSGATEYKYMEKLVEVTPEWDKWVIPPNIDDSMFDYTWRPDPREPAFIYKFGTQWQKTGGPRYVCEDATEIKYLDNQKVKILPNKENWTIPDKIDISNFDFSWHPDDTSPPYIYLFATQWAMSGGPTYTVENATEVKYIDATKAIALSNRANWEISEYIDADSFDFSWHPYAEDEPYIYVFGTQWQKTGGPKYITPGTHENSPIKYIDTRIIKAKRLPNKKAFNVLDNNIIIDFDYSWHPDDTDQPYIYLFGNNQYPAEIMPTIEYIVEGSSQVKYINDVIAKLGVNKTNWTIPSNIDDAGFDYSWVPNPKDPEYIYEFATQWQKTGGPKYIVPGATEVKYLDTQKVKILPSKSNWTIPDQIDISNFDFSWHPDNTSPPYIYRFATQWAMSGGPVYTVPEATEKKYIDMPKARALPNKDNWLIPDTIDVDSFDFSWHPYTEDEPYIYVFGTQWQKTGGPKYMTPGTHENSPIKYIDTRIIKAKRLPNAEKFKVLNNIVISDFDYSWHPDETEESYIYVFGNNQYPAEIMPTIEYVVPGATQIKYVNNVVATLGPNKTNWKIIQPINENKFDFSWVPNPKDPPYTYVWGNKYISNLYKHTIEYHVEGATEIKYMDELVEVLPELDRWVIPTNIDDSSFDYTWRPDPLEADFIWQFGTQWQKTGGPRYIMPGATEVKYIDTQKAKALPTTANWRKLDNLVIEDFDYSWHPDITDQPYIYVFGNNLHPAEIMPTIEYVLPGTDQIKYVNDISAKLGKDMSNWTVPNNIDKNVFDFTWKPNPKDPPFIYQFGTQWQKTGGPRYITPGTHKNSPVKYIDIIKAKRLPNRQDWIIPDDIDIKSFDFSWHVDETEPSFYIHQFGTQHQKTGGPQHVPKEIPRLASGKPIGQIKYVDVIKAKKLANMTYWLNPNNADVKTFDFSWHPDDTSPPTTYQFGTLVDREDGPKYIHPDTLDDVVVFMERIEKITEDDIQNIIVPRYEIETTLEDLVKQHPNEIFWAMHKNIDYDAFDFDWRPEIVNIQWENEYVYVFGSPDSEITQTYFVNASMYLKGNTDYKFIQTEVLTEKYLSTLFKKSDMFFVDRSNNESQERFEKLKQKFPTIQKTRYLNSWVDTINRCINRSTTELAWILNSELDYTNFDFEYYPNPWQMKMVQVFGTQWSHWGTTFMVNRETFAQDTKHIKIIEHLSNLNFVKDRKAKATNVLYDIIYIDHGNVDTSTLQGNTIIKYQNSYITTFQKMLDILPVKKEHYIWVASTVCDYKDFDFTYICDPFAKEQLHVFPSDRQKFGDTFLVDVNKLRTLIEDMNVLEDYVKINYNQSQRAKRLPPPVIVTEGDTHVSNIDAEFNFPYAVFTTNDNKDINIVDSEPISLWTPESKNIQITSTGGTRIVVPKEAKDYVKRELYDYPYITTNSRLAKSSPMDIVFLSNGETGAEENYEHLLKVTHGLPNRVTRVDGVNGRVAAYHAAAEASNTPWMFTVFAKLKVSNKFDWNWQPDRLQLPKHYVFHATNPVNGLKYGHMAMIAYNKKLTLANQGKGLDFTMDDEHEVLEINSGIANFNTDEWSTWRTAFREALKLCADSTEISKNRLEMWLTVGMGKFNEYSTEGAQHAVEYYEEVNGDFDKLKLSYDWPWLRAYYKDKYK